MKNQLIQLFITCWFIALAALLVAVKVDRPLRQRRF
jgi:hypothetical protein